MAVGSLIGLVVLGAAALLGFALLSGRVTLPDRYNPWAPLDMRAPDDLFLRSKLARLAREPVLCRTVLADADLEFEPLEDRVTGPGCGFDNAVLITRIGSAVTEPFSLSCPAAVSLALWHQQIVESAAARHFNSGVARIEHFGSYACRGLYGREDARRSQHATAEAFDFAGLTLENGQRIRVLGDWHIAAPARTPGHADEFLRELHAGACRYFDAVLGPAYNAAHRDHFHLDRGRARVCR